MTTPQKQILAVKRAVRVRDGMRCIQCGMTNEQHRAKHGRALHVHRVRPGSEYIVEACITLCATCHGKAPKRSPGEFDVERKGVLYVLEIPTEVHRRLDALRAAKRWSKQTAALAAFDSLLESEDG